MSVSRAMNNRVIVPFPCGLLPVHPHIYNYTYGLDMCMQFERIPIPFPLVLKEAKAPRTPAIHDWETGDLPTMWCIERAHTQHYWLPA